MSLRTDKVSGMLTCGFGIVLCCFATCGLLIAALQRVMLRVMPPMRHPSGASFTVLFDAGHGLFFVYFPILIIGGIILGVAGYYVMRGSLVARRVAQGVAIIGYFYVVAYSVSCYQVLDHVSSSMFVVSKNMTTVFFGISTVGGALFNMAFPSGLLYILSRPRVRPTATDDGKPPDEMVDAEIV